MNYGRQKNNEPTKIIKNINNKNKEKVKDMDKDEEEYECLNNGNKLNNHLLFSSISFKSHEVDLIFNRNFINNNDDNNINNKNYIINLSKKKDVDNSGNKNDINDNQNIYEYANKIYNSDEHLNNNNLIYKRKKSLNNLFNLNNSPEKAIKKTVLSKIDHHRKSLFYVGDIKDEEKLTINRKLRESLISKEKLLVRNNKKKK